MPRARPWCPVCGARARKSSVARKSSIDQLPEPIRVAVDEELARGRLTLDQVLEKLEKAFGDTELPSRSALGRRKQRLDKIVAKHRQTNEIMKVFVKQFGSGNSQMARGIIEMLRMSVHEVAEQLSADEEPNVGALSALALAMKRLASAEEVTVKVEERLREQLLEELEEGESVKQGPRKLDQATLDYARSVIRGEA